jgi:predicted Fe-Mo cluster-binding NifX family protein
MKVAISTDNGMVAEHFGRCPQFTIATIDNGKVLEKRVIENPGHETGFLPKYFNEQGIESIIAGGAGFRAIQLFKEYGISFFGAEKQSVEQALEKLAKGELKESSGSCAPQAGIGYGIPKADGHEH